MEENLNRTVESADEFIDRLLAERCRRGLERRMEEDFLRHYRRNRILLAVLIVLLLAVVALAGYLMAPSGAWGATDGWASRQAAMEAVDQIFLAL